ncbi:MAG: flagellar hook basal-body protein [Calditrichota bacterium]
MRNISAAIASMVGRMRQLEITANNLANVNTPGFKRNLYFNNILEDLLSRDVNQSEFNSSLRLEERERTDFSQGILHKTDNPLDLAFNGDGYFVVQTDQGLAYSRNGNFTRDANGYLVTNNGDYVLGEGGPIQLPDGQVEVSKAGFVMVDGQLIDRFRVVKPTDIRQIVTIFRQWKPIMTMAIFCRAFWKEVM